MKIVLAVDAIFPPLTGIGRYAWELAWRLRDSREVRHARFFSMGRWIADPAQLLGAGGTPPRRRVTVAARRYLASQPLAVTLYSAIAPRWYAHVLRDHGDYLFHSPNYFLPPAKGPCVATVHDLSNYKYPETHPAARRKLFDRQFRFTLDHACHLITDAETTRNEIIEHFGWPGSRITAVHLGVSPRFRPMNADETRPTLAKHGLAHQAYGFCVSTVEPRKRIDALLNAYAALDPALRKKYPLVLVGGQGWLSEDLHRLIDRYRAAGWLHYLDYLPEPELAAIYAGARSFFFLSAYEGFGLPVLEAMAAGVPVLTSDKSCLPETAGGAALLVAPDDPDAVRQGISRALLDEAWRKQARVAGLARAASLSWERCFERTLAVYRSIRP